MTVVNSGTENELWGPQRSRTVTWHDPGPGTARGLTMAGVDYLKAMIAGELPPPPIAALMQFELVEAEPGKVVFTCSPDGSVYNPNGGVHGGLVCTLLDSVAGLAVHSTLPAGKGYTSIEIKVNYLKAVRLGSRQRRVRCGRGDRSQHAAGVRPVGIPGCVRAARRRVTAR